MAKANCSELAKTTTELAMVIAIEENLDNIDDVVKVMKKIEPRINREVVVQAINEATTNEQRIMAEETRIRNALRNEARSDKTLHEAIREYDNAIAEERQVDIEKKERKEPPAAIKELQEAKKRLKKIYESKWPKEKKDNAIKIEQERIRRIQTRIDMYEKAIAEERKIQETKRERKEPTKAVKALMDAEKAIKKKYEKSNPVYGEKLSKQIRELRRKLELPKKDFPLPQPKEPVAISKEMEKLQLKRDVLRRDLRLKIESMKPKTGWEKFWGYTAEPFNFMRAMMSSMELSGFLRQGAAAVGSHPLALGGTSIKRMLQAAATEKGAYRIEKEIENRDNYRWYQKYLEMTSWESSSRLAKMEEAFMSRIAAMIPGIKQSERAYVTGLNYIRASLFDLMASNATKSGGELTDAEAKGIAYYVNVATGRGQMGKFKGAAPALSTLFFSPRWFVSRVQFLTGMPLFKAGSNRIRLQIAKEYVRYATSVAAMLTLAGLMGWELEDDPRSTDFGKAKKGNVRVDFTAGLSQLITLAARVGTGEYKSSVAGEVKALRGEDKPYGGMSTAELLGNTLIRYKLSPGVSTIFDIITGEDAVGKPIEWYESIGRHAFPIYWQDAKDILTSELGIEEKAAVVLLGFVGESINVYEEREQEQDKKIGRTNRRVRRR